MIQQKHYNITIYALRFYCQNYLAITSPKRSLHQWQYFDSWKKWMVSHLSAKEYTEPNALIGEDNQFHLTGTTHILNTVSIFSSSGGLGEAAAWLCLRQDIYVSLTTQQPLRTNLVNFRSSNIFYRADDFAWSSRIVFLLARVLQNAFSDPAATIQIQHEVEEWYTAKPSSFEPVRVVPRGMNQRFPQIWMLLPVHGKFFYKGGSRRRSLCSVQ